jgi:ABC-2 type transport system ATP-binding protein
MPDPVVEVSGLTVTFGDVHAVDGVSFEIQTGEVFGLVGPNGAGKTTTVRVLVTLQAATGGQARVAGLDVRRDPFDVRRVIGYVPQLLSANGSLTGYENLELSARLYGVPTREREARIREVIDLMDLREAAGRLVRTYSGGMIRRLEIAQGVLHRPRVLFLDEPTVGLDPVARRSVWDLVERLRREDGTAMLVTTHYMDEADEFCDRVAIMHHGHIVAMGTPAELKRDTGMPAATLEDAFVYYTGASLQESGGSFHDAATARRTARRLG